MQLLAPVLVSAGTGGPAATADTTVGALARPVLELSGRTPVSDVELVFRGAPGIAGVAVVTDDGPLLLTRSRLDQLLVGPLGFGRAVTSRRAVADVLDRSSSVMAADTPLAVAAQLLLQRPLAERYDDVLVDGPDRLGVLPVSAVFEQLARHFAHQAVHDPLTGLPNRSLLSQTIRERLPGPDRWTAGPALLYVDLDGFKAVNDDRGHDVGDAVLVEYAQRLRDAVRPGDVVARLGGDEFAVLLTDDVSDEHAMAIAERLVLVAAAPFVVGGAVVSVGASVGIARADAGAEQRLDTVETLLRSADTAMYRAKRLGRGRVERCSEDDGSGRPLPGRGGGALERRLRTALSRGALHLVYQGKYELRTGRLLEHEALARWDDRSGSVSPAVFIPVAEQSGLIHPLGHWALEAACTDAAGWVGEDGGAAPVVAVNVSPQQLADPTFVADVSAVLDRTGLDPSRLSLEITETSAIADLDATCSQLGHLRGLGVQVALDDFGTGHASLTLLRALPLDWVKVDRSFVEEVAEDPAGAVLVRLVIEAAHSLGVRVCAEGVERPEQLAQLTAMGCDAVQGFLLSVPSRTPARGRSAEIAAATGTPALLAGAGQVVLTCDRTGRITYASAEAVQVLGSSPAELTGVDLRSIVLDSTGRPDGAQDDLLHLDGQVQVRPVRHRNGTVVWVEAGVRALTGRSDHASALLITAVDVTARVRAEQALAACLRDA